VFREYDFFIQKTKRVKKRFLYISGLHKPVCLVAMDIYSVISSKQVQENHSLEKHFSERFAVQKRVKNAANAIPPQLNLKNKKGIKHSVK
jgi:hypothetical protein